MFRSVALIDSAASAVQSPTTTVFTFTVLITSTAALSAASETLYVITYVPAVVVSTISPPTTMSSEISPSTASVAVAP
ncbi:MAG: Uncharacterised protein [Polaribacter sejongensis]|nr:MAG: Uncharacterised protein [Polaribacter sejongensis]